MPDNASAPSSSDESSAGEASAADADTPPGEADAASPPHENEGEEAPGGDRLPFPVVGIGASAGGLGAFRTFLKHLPEEPGMAFVLVQHLDPDRESELPRLLQRATSMKVMHVEEHDGGMPLEANCIYVIPPGRNMTIDGGKLHLTEMTGPRAERAPIDHFFRSLAESQDGNAVGIVLSGTGTGGTLGLRRIKEHGGVTMAQAPAEAEFEGMPHSALRTGLVDVVAPAAELAEKLAQYRNAFSAVRLPRDGDALEERDEEVLSRMFALLHKHTGHDFSSHKRATILRRLRRRMQLQQIEALPAYLDYLQSHEDEAQALSEDFLITVTNFFRDREAFEALREEVIPKLFENKDAGDTVRVWVAGCATGEEAYSLAILLREHADTIQGPIPEVQIFATDLGEGAIHAAREGFYPQSIAADLSEDRLSRYFDQESDGYRARTNIREPVIFARHDLMSDPPFSQLDLVVCRNLLIYLQREVQRGIFEVFHYALRPGGRLFLGSAESTEEAKDLFRTVDKSHRIYRRRDGVAKAPRFADMPFMQPGQEQKKPETPERRQPASNFEDIRLQILEAYAPPGVVVSEQNEIVHVFEGGHRYLQVPPGPPTHDVMELVRPALRTALRTALLQARSRGEETTSREVAVEVDGLRRVRCVVRPVKDTDFVQVVFEATNEADGKAADSLSEQQRVVQRDAEAYDAEAEQLEEELQEVRQELSTIVEEYETAMEEQRASNEELQSMNEELRSATEELETSKAELQSMNEELTTVNQELNSKNEELSRVNNDLQNLLTSTKIATLFLDRDLRIQRYTPRAEELFNIIEADRGRPIDHVTRRFDHAGFVSDARQVLKELVPLEREVENDGGQRFLMRFRPYRTVEDKIDGVVVTFVDVTERKEAEKGLRRSEERYRLLVENAEEYAIFTMDPEGHISSWNTGAENTFGYSEAEVLGRPGALIFTEEDRAEGAPEHEREQAIQTGQATDEHWHVRKSGDRFWGTGTMTALRDPDDGELRGLAKVMRDNTERKQNEEALQELNDTLEERVEERTRELRRQEERFRKLVEASAQMVWTADAEGQVVEDSPSWRAFTGQSVDEWKGKGWANAVHPDDRTDVLRNWRRSVETETPIDTEMRLYHAETDSWRWVHVRAVPLRDAESSAVHGWIGMSTDITERKRTEHRVHRLVQALIKTEERERRRIASILHDDLQQQLYGAEMTARRARRLLQESDLGEEALAPFNEVCDQMDEILDGAVETTRTLSTELSPTVLRDEDLTSILDWLAGHMQERHGLAVEVNVEGAPLVENRQLRTLLLRLVRELLFNVVKHAETDRATLDACVTEGWLILQVSDEGQGFDPEQLEQRDRGLGLVNMRERLYFLSGRLEIESVPGRGTRVTIALPDSFSEPET